MVRYLLIVNAPLEFLHQHWDDVEQGAEAADKLDLAPFEQLIVDRILSQIQLHSGWKRKPFIFITLSAKQI